MGIERPLILGERDAVKAPHASGQNGIQVAPETLQSSGNIAGRSLHVVHVGLPRCGRLTFLGGVVIEFLPGLSVILEKVALQPFENRPRQASRRRHSTGEHSDIGREQLEPPVLQRAVGEEPLDPAGQTRKNVAQPLERILAGALRCEIARPGLERALQHILNYEPAVDHLAETCPYAWFA